MAIGQHKDGENNGLQALEESLLICCEGGEKAIKRESSLWMVLLCTLVAVCGSFEFGSCVSSICTSVIVIVLVRACLSSCFVTIWYIGCCLWFFWIWIMGKFYFLEWLWNCFCSFVLKKKLHLFYLNFLRWFPYLWSKRV